MHALILSLMLLLADASPSADLVGQVVGPDNAPIASATVIVYSAAPKKGDSPIQPSDFSDCQKSVQTEADGSFKIAGVDAALSFRLLVLADNYRPLVLNKVDPSKGSIVASVKELPKDLDADHMIKGHVVDGTGAPVVGAKIEPFGCQDGNDRWWGPTDKICENETYSDAKGQFVLVARKPDVRIDLRVYARHLAPLNDPLVPLGDADHDITLAAGASVTGRLLKDDKPVAGVRMCLVQQERGVEHYITDFHATTDAEGKFNFNNVHASDNYYLYATMKSMHNIGALSIKSCAVGADGTTADGGDLIVESGFTVTGSVFCSDNKPIPEGAKVHLSRWETGGDSLDATIGADGKFEFKNAPNELSEFWVQIHEYHLSEENVSYEPMNASFLLGKVDDDIKDLRVQLDPDPAPDRNNNSNKWQMLQTTRLTGIQPQQ